MRFLALLLALCAQASGAYSFYRTIDIDPTLAGASDSSHFRLLVKGTYSYLATTGHGGEVQSASGYDVGFFTSSACTTKLDWQTELYTATDGTVLYHVALPAALSHTVITRIYQCTGDASITVDQSNTTGTFSSSHGDISVYHLGDGSSLSAADATGVFNGTVNGAAATTGAIDGGASFGGSQNITMGSLTQADSLTAGAVEFYVSSAAYDGGFAAYHSGPSLNNIGASFPAASNGTMDFYVGANTPIYHSTKTDWALNTLYSVAYTWDGSNVKIYVNGAPDSTTSSAAGTVSGSTAPVCLGSYCFGPSGATTGGFLTGKLDEVRISSVARSADYFTARWNNESSPSTFYAIGPQTAVGGATAAHRLRVVIH
jgi:hypothetical protein